MITMAQIEQLWLGVVDQMPPRTPAHVVALLRADFMSDFGSGRDCDPLHVVLRQTGPGQSNAAVSIKLHIVETYVALAYEHRHARDWRNVEMRLDAPKADGEPAAHVVASMRKQVE